MNPLAFRFLAAALAVLAVGNAATAQNQTPAVPVPIEHKVVVPYDRTKPAASQSPRQYYLDYAAFEQLWKAAKDHKRDPNPAGDRVEPAAQDFILTNALYKGTVKGNRLEVEGQLSVLTRGKAWQPVALPFSAVNLSKIELDGVQAAYRDGAVLIEKPGSHLVTVVYEVALPKQGAPVAWTIPIASASLLALTMDDVAAEPVVNGGLPLVKSTEAGGSTVYTAALGQAGSIDFRRRLRTASRDLPQPSVGRIDSHLFVSPALERLEAAYRFEFTGQEETRFSISFDPSLVPVRFEIPNLASWRIEKPASGPVTLEFDLTQPARDRLEVKLIAERLVSDLAAPRAYPALGASALRVEQTRSLLSTADLSMKVQPGPGHRQAEFRAGGVDTAGFRAVGTFALNGGKDAPLAFSLTAEAPKRGAVADYVFQVSPGKLETIGQFQIRSPGTPLTGFAVGLPTGASVQTVEGNRVSDWWRQGDMLHVRFSGDTPEVTALLIYIAQTLDADVTTVPIASFSLPDLPGQDRVTGSGLIVAHLTRDTTLRFDQDRRLAREVGADEVAADFEVLAPLERKRGFRFDRAGFTGSVELKPIEPRYDVSWVMLAQAHESWLRLSVQTDVEIGRSAIDRIVFATDESVPELRVVSPEVREMRSTVADGRREYTVIFQNHIADAVSFTLETEITHTGAGSLPDLDFPGAARLERFVIVENHSRDRIDIERAGLDPTVRDLLPYVPDTIGSAELFRARPGWELTVSMEKLASSAGNEGIVLYAELTTAFRASGEEWLKAVYHLQNRALQFLPVALPGDAELVSASVAGEDVRADRGEIDGRPVVLIPLIQTKPGQLAYDVTLVLRNRTKAVDRRLRALDRDLDDPEVIGVTVERTLWNVHLPAGHRLSDTDGNMKRVEIVANQIEKLQSDLSELRDLNYLGAGKKVDAETRKRAIDNGGIVIEKLEQEIRQSGLGGRDDLMREIAQQKSAWNLNRAQTPGVSQGVQAQGAGKDKVINWERNSAEIANRKSAIDSKNREQHERLETRVRLNDNIAIGNTFFNPQVYQQTDSQGQAVQQVEIQQQQQQKEVPELKKQISKLSQEDERQSSQELAKKLSALNFQQLGHGGFDGDQSGAGGFDTARPNTPNQRGYIDLGQGQNQPQPRPAAPPMPGQAGATSAPAAAGAPPAVVNPEGRYSQLGSNARQQIVQIDNVEKPAGKSEAPGGFFYVPNEAPAPAPAGDALRPGGRRSVAVDFPVEGEAYHFQKLRDHAELTVESREPAKLDRLAALAWLLVSLALLFAGERLWRRWTLARQAI